MTKDNIKQKLLEYIDGHEETSKNTNYFKKVWI